MNVRVLYFARLRETFGIAQESITFAQPATVADLLALLRARGGAWFSELEEGRAYRVAVDQEVADASTPLTEGAEVAIFPPVTGG